MGRGLRRRSYTVGDDGMLTPEYADIFGVPFSGFPVAGLPEERDSGHAEARQGRPRDPGTARSTPLGSKSRSRASSAIASTCPPNGSPRNSTRPHREVLTTQDIPTHVSNAPIVGEKAELTLEEAKELRPQTVAFMLATHLQQQHFSDRPWLFPQLLAIVRDWLGDPDGDSPNVDYGDDTFPGLLVFGQKKSAVCEKIARAIIAASGGEQRLRAELPETDFLGTTVGVAVRHRQGLLDDRSGQVPLQPRSAGQRLGNHRVRQARRDGRGARLRQEPGHRLPHPVHLRWPGRQLYRT